MFNRKKDLNSDLVTSELARKDPWYKDVVPNVSPPRPNHYNEMQLTSPVPRHPIRSTRPRSRQRLALHLRMHQHSHLFTLACRPVSEKRRSLQTRHHKARRLGRRHPPHRPKSLPRSELHGSRIQNPTRRARRQTLPRPRTDRRRPQRPGPDDDHLGHRRRGRRDLLRHDPCCGRGYDPGRH